MSPAERQAVAREAYLEGWKAAVEAAMHCEALWDGKRPCSPSCGICNGPEIPYGPTNINRGYRIKEVQE